MLLWLDRCGGRFFASHIDMEHLWTILEPQSHRGGLELEDDVPSKIKRF